MPADQSASRWEALLGREADRHQFQQTLQSTLESFLSALALAPGADSQQSESATEQTVDQSTGSVSPGDAFALFAAMEATDASHETGSAPGMDASSATDVAPPTEEAPPIGVLHEGHDHEPAPPSSTDPTSGSVTVLLGKGDGTFTLGPVTDLPLPSGLGKLAERLGDSRLGALLSARWFDHGWPWWLHGRAFFHRLFLPLGRFGSSEHGVTAADLTGDNKLDLAIFGHGHPLLLTGKGDGSFEMTNHTGIGVGSWQLALNFFGFHQGHAPFGSSMQSTTGDFNKDGQADLAFVLPGSKEVTLLVSQPNGSYARSTAPLTLQDNMHVMLATGDFNNDGNSDLAVIQLTAHDHPKLTDLWERLLTRFPMLGGIWPVG